MRNLSTSTALGLCCIAFALLIVFLWVPFDTETWLVERKRGRFIVGDSLAPTLAGSFILLSGVLLVLERREHDPGPTRENLVFVAAMIGIGAIGILLMRWAGPAITALVAGGEEYRLLRDTVPWKYLGFAAGGAVIVFGMIAFVEERPTFRAFCIAVLAVAGIILLYDVPFEDVLLPPNGDV